MTARYITPAYKNWRGEMTAHYITAAYKNWRGEVRVRKLIPVSIYFGSTDWHPESQWLMKARDIEGDPNQVKDYALKDFVSMEAYQVLVACGQYDDSASMDSLLASTGHWRYKFDEPEAARKVHEFLGVEHKPYKEEK